MPDLSIRAAAAQLGISHTALRKRIGHGRVTWPPSSLAALQAEWEANKDVAQQQRGTAKSTSAPSALRPALPPGIPTQAVSNAREAALKVEERALKIAQKKGMLLDAARVNAYIGGMILRAAEVLDRLPDELADRLAQMSDPVACKELLRSELARARFELAEYRA